MLRRSVNRFVLLVPLVGLAVAVGCAETRPKLLPERPKAYYSPAAICDECGENVPRPPKNVLLITSGGLFGAYPSGFLNGWTNTGTRPEFDVVTGCSTGALIGLCAFLGPEYDQLAKSTYTMVTRKDIYTVRSWYLIPFSSSVASNEPLKERVENAITPEVMTRLAAAHRAGRRFYVGTTELATRKHVSWDVGAIACRDTPGARTLVVNVLVASCAIPGMFPPVPIAVGEKGCDNIEWHVDGGTTAPLFAPPGLISPQNNATAGGMTIFVLVAGKYYAEPALVKPRVLKVLSASVPAVTYAHTRSEIASLSHLCKLAGAGFRITALPQEFVSVGDLIAIGADELGRMFLEGYRLGSSGPTWDPGPPTESAAGDPPRQ